MTVDLMPKWRRYIIKSGDEIDVLRKDILHVKAKREAADRTAALVGGVILTVVAAAAIIIAASKQAAGYIKFGK